MKLSLNWIGEFVDLGGLEPESLAERLTRVTAEIESLERRGAGLREIVTARVVDVSRHPKAGRLTVCSVDAGAERLDVVCGAPNVRAGCVVAFAPPGSRLPGGQPIERAEIRGVASHGMICSLAELRLGEDADGIWILPDDTPIGRPLPAVLPVEDAIIEIDNKSLTHRPDLWGHYGFAREFAAFLGRPLRPLPVVSFAAPGGRVPISVEDPKWCPRYVGAVLRGVGVRRSPAWLQMRLESVGVRPRNNVVDLTNYVMLEIGQPTHAFDLDRLAGPEIRVRRARAGERIRTLDGVDRVLSEEALVIADRERAVAVAGVMGGADSEIADATRTILLESANFEPSNVRKTAQRLQLRTDASTRFEKSLDPEFARLALGRILALLPQVVPGASLEGGVTDVFPAPPEPKRVDLRLETVHRRLGVPVPEERVRSILAALEFEVASIPGGLRVTVPSFRATKDVSIEMDLVEEIGRLFGYDAIPECKPRVVCEPSTRNRVRALEREVKTLLSGGLGFNEVATYSFTEEAVIRRAGLDPERHLHVRNPIAADLACLRVSIVPNLLALLEANLRLREEVRVYEVGRSYVKDDRKSQELPRERRDVVAVLCRRKVGGGNGGRAFFDLKGVCEALLDRLSLRAPQWRASGAARDPWVHPSHSAELWVGGARLGEIAEIHPEIARTFHVEAADTAFFRIDLDTVLCAERPQRLYEPLPRFPAIRQDISVVVPVTLRAAAVEQAIRDVAPDIIAGVRLFDVFTGGRIGAGKRSLTFEITYRAADRTLKDADAAAIHARVVERVRGLGGTVRGL
jgi:phenylalanyl-tRNA synthetase beta chain